MDSELFKELKEAGFTGPETERNNFPDLSELIIGCNSNGCSFKSLRKMTKDAWIAEGYGKSVFPLLVCHGNTSLEAISRLWLALNKKV